MEALHSPVRPLILIAAALCASQAHAAPLGSLPGVAAAEESAPPAAATRGTAEAAATDDPAILERRISPGAREVYVKPVKGTRVRGMIAPKEPFEVLERVSGTGCGGDGWARVQASGYACLEGTTVTEDEAVLLPRLARFDPPVPDEYASYIDTGTYDDDAPDDAELLLPYIYGKPWRKWKGNLYASADAYGRGAAPVGKLETGAIRKSHFVSEVETAKGRVLVREDGKVSPLDDVFVYPVSRHQGHDLQKNPLPPGTWPAWTISYDGAEVHRTPDAASDVAVLLPHHKPIVVRDVAADASGHWWEMPDFFGPGQHGYVSDVTGIRHPTKRARPAEVGPDEMWVDIDLAQQIFMLYQGDELRYVTLVASGDMGWGTPKGLYRIQKKSVTADMSSRADAAEPYYVEDVPWTMHFWPRYALHGVFWHWGLGQIASHGCVNLAPRDARYVFDTIGPQVPKGWTHMWSTEEDPGTTIRIRMGDVEGPDRRKANL